jgi:hypothetical protein
MTRWIPSASLTVRGGGRRHGQASPIWLVADRNGHCGKGAQAVFGLPKYRTKTGCIYTRKSRFVHGCAVYMLKLPTIRKPYKTSYSPHFMGSVQENVFCSSEPTVGGSNPSAVNAINRGLDWLCGTPMGNSARVVSPQQGHVNRWRWYSVTRGLISGNSQT